MISLVDKEYLMISLIDKGYSPPFYFKGLYNINLHI